MRAYVGEADSVRERIGKSAEERGFWETAVVITTADEALTKGHVRYLEARIIDIAKNAGRVAIDNIQAPDANRRRLPEADRANMEAFISNLKVVLPVIGVDLLKPRPQAITRNITTASDVPLAYQGTETQFEIRHKSGVKALAVEEDGEFVVLAGSGALKDAGHQGSNTYGEFKQELIAQGVLAPTTDGSAYLFTRPQAFKSPSAASAVILDRNSNGRREWKVVGSKLNYHEWQAGKVEAEQIAGNYWGGGAVESSLAG